MGFCWWFRFTCAEERCPRGRATSTTTQKVRVWRSGSPASSIRKLKSPVFYLFSRKQHRQRFDSFHLGYRGFSQIWKQKKVWCIFLLSSIYSSATVWTVPGYLMDESSVANLYQRRKKEAAQSSSPPGLVPECLDFIWFYVKPIRNTQSSNLPLRGWKYLQETVQKV